MNPFINYEMAIKEFVKMGVLSVILYMFANFILNVVNTKLDKLIVTGELMHITHLEQTEVLKDIRKELVPKTARK